MLSCLARFCLEARGRALSWLGRKGSNRALSWFVLDYSIKVRIALAINLDFLVSSVLGISWPVLQASPRRRKMCCLPRLSGELGLRNAARNLGSIQLLRSLSLSVAILPRVRRHLNHTRSSTRRRSRASPTTSTISSTQTASTMTNVSSSFNGFRSDQSEQALPVHRPSFVVCGFVDAAYRLPPSLLGTKMPLPAA